MRVSDRYIGRQVLTATVYALLFLSTVLILGTALKKIRVLLVDFDADLSVVGELLVGALPVSLIYTIPWAFLAAVLLVYGRLSSDQELTAFRVSGVSLTRLSAPVFIIASLLSALCLWLNLAYAPQAAAAVDGITLRAFMRDPRSMLVAAAERDGLERLEDSMRGTKAFISKSDGRNIEGLHIFRTPTPADRSRTRNESGTGGSAEMKQQNVYVYAKKAATELDDTKQEFRFRLYSALFVTRDENGAPRIAVTGEAVPVVLPYQLSSKDRKKPGLMSNPEIREFLASPKGQEYLTNPKRVSWYLNFLAEIHRRYASSFACLAFALVGVPLGISARRRDTATGLVFSLIIGTAYFAISGIRPASMNTVVLLAWTPNLLCLGLGIFLFRRARFR